MQAILIEEILPEIPVPSDWTLGRQRLGNWQISSNHPIASTKENKAWKRTGGDKEHCMGIQASQSGDNIHVSIYPFWSTPLVLIASWDWDQPTFADATNFCPSLSHSECPTWPCIGIFCWDEIGTTA